MAKKSSAAPTRLQIALDGKVRTVSQLQIAKLAGVSTRTLSMITLGKFATDPPTSVRQLKGHIGTLARLARYFELNIPEALSEYGIDSTLPNIQKLIEESLKKPHQETDDQATRHADVDLLPIMQGVCESGYSGEVLLSDLQILLSLREQAGKNLTPAVIREILLLQHPGSPGS